MTLTEVNLQKACHLNAKLRTLFIRGYEILILTEDYDYQKIKQKNQGV